MGYCVIEGHLTYIPKKVWDEFEKDEFNKLGVFQRGMYKINDWGDESRDKIMDSIIKNFQELYKEAPELFIGNYVNFHFTGKQAAENVKPLLDCFCHLYGFAKTKEIYGRNSNVGDLSLYETPYIQFDQYIPINRGNFLKGIFQKKEYRTITTVINIEEVLKIEGDLSYFEIHTETNYFLFTNGVCAFSASADKMKEILTNKTITF